MDSEFKDLETIKPGDVMEEKLKTKQQLLREPYEMQFNTLFHPSELEALFMD